MINKNEFSRLDNYEVILFELSHIWANFWGYINKILTKKLNIFDIAYLNDILIYIKDLEKLYIKTVC